MDDDEEAPAGPRSSARLTVFRLSLAVAIFAIVLTFAADWARDRRDRLLAIADNHARVGAEYGRNAGGNPRMLVISEWHAEMKRRFEWAAARPWVLTPESRILPPPGWPPSPR